MLKRMEDEFKLVKVTVPLGIDESDKTSPQAHILISYVAQMATKPSTFLLSAHVDVTVATWIQESNNQIDWPPAGSHETIGLTQWNPSAC